MNCTHYAGCCHPVLTRRAALRAGAVGLLGLTELSALRELAGAEKSRARSVIFVFLTGGLSHLDSFDLKPDAPDTVRGEFQSIATKTPGIRVCEHLPLRLDAAGRIDRNLWCVDGSVARASRSAAGAEKKSGPHSPAGWLEAVPTR